jgi:hypothetical protein
VISFRSTTLFVLGGGAISWLFHQMALYKAIQAHETSPLVNRGRRWDCIWPNTSVDLWEEAVRELSHVRKEQEANIATLAMYHERAPNPEPIRILFENALDNPNHSLDKMRQSTTRGVFRVHAFHASDELRRLRRYDDAARLDAARDEVLPWGQQYGDNKHREGIFAQGKPARKLPFPKFK